ncbi:hypothetical protein MJI46_34915, partial [Salmonella enterica subsp. enterica serovar Cerro]|nr:hypothetical protein [Salmonella enterica subsp. enterica serovar Cerro]
DIACRYAFIAHAGHQTNHIHADILHPLRHAGDLFRRARRNTETLPVPLSEKEILEIARAGADGLHTHKSDWDDLQDIVNLAH